MFTLANAVFLKPLPVSDVSRLAVAFWIDGGTKVPGMDPARRLPASYPNYADFRARNRVFADLAAFQYLEATLSRPRVYGLMTNSVIRRTNEIGIRMALGATPGGIRHLVLCRAMVLTGIGVLAGGGTTLVLAPLARPLLFSVPPYDPVALLFTTAAFAAVAATACWLPAERAAQMSPVRAIRQN